MTAKAIRKKKSKQKRHIQSALSSLDDKLGKKPINNYDILQSSNSTSNPIEQTTKPSATTSSTIANPYLQTPSMSANLSKMDIQSPPNNANNDTGSSSNVKNNTDTNMVDSMPTVPAAPTPIERNNPYLSTLTNAQQIDVDPESQMKKPFSDMDESEKLRKKNRAAALISMNYDRISKNEND